MDGRSGREASQGAGGSQIMKRSKPTGAPCACCGAQDSCRCAGRTFTAPCAYCQRCKAHCGCPDGWLDPMGSPWLEVDRRKRMYV